MNQLSYKPAVSNELGPMFEEEPDSNELNENTETYQSYLTDPADLQPLSTDPDSLQFYKSISSNIPEMNNGGFTLNNENVENNPNNPNVPNIFDFPDPDSSKKVSFDEDQLKITKESITELNNLSYQLTEYNTTVLDYDHTQNRIPSFLGGNVALIEPPKKNIATNKQVDKQNTSNILNNSATVDENTQKAQIVQITKNDQQYNTAEAISDNSRTYNIPSIKNKAQDRKSSRKLPIIPANEPTNKDYWLNDLNIDLVLDIFQKNYGSVNIVTLAQQAWFDIDGWNINFENTENLILILNLGNHWITITNIDTQTVNSSSQNRFNKNIFLYDSLYDFNNLNALKPILKKMFPTRDSYYVNKVHMPYKQQSGNDCGLFALAYALCLCERQEPSVIKFDQDTMRQSYNKCVECDMRELNFITENTNTLSRINFLCKIILHSSIDLEPQDSFFKSNIPNNKHADFTSNNENVENNQMNDDQSNSDVPNVLHGLSIIMSVYKKKQSQIRELTRDLLKLAYNGNLQLYKYRVVTGQINPNTKVKKCPNCSLEFTEIGLKSHQQNNPSCANKQKQISENKLKEPIQNENENKEETVKSLLIRHNLWEKEQAVAEYICDDCKRGFNSISALHLHDTRIHKQKQNPNDECFSFTRDSNQNSLIDLDVSQPPSPDSFAFLESFCPDKAKKHFDFNLINENVEKKTMNDDRSNSDNPNVPNIFDSPLNSAKKVSKKIINKSIDELTNQYLQSTEYNTTVLDYDHTQNRVPSFLGGNVVSIEPPKNIAINKKVDKQDTLNNLNAQQLSATATSAYSVKVVDSIEKKMHVEKSSLTIFKLGDPEKTSVKMRNSKIKYTDPKYQEKTYNGNLQLYKYRVVTGQINPNTKVKKCPYCSLEFTEKGLKSHQKNNPSCANKQKQISENKLKEPIQNENENKEETVKSLLIRHNLWEKVQAVAEYICDDCERGFNSLSALHHHDTRVHKQKQNPNSKKRKY